MLVRPESQVELTLAQIVLLGVVPQPGQLQTEVCLPVPQVDDDEAAVVRDFSLPDRFQVQSLLVEGQ